MMQIPSGYSEKTEPHHAGEKLPAHLPSSAVARAKIFPMKMASPFILGCQPNHLAIAQPFMVGEMAIHISKVPAGLDWLLGS
jgi:hypothetical protein